MKQLKPGLSLCGFSITKKNKNKFLMVKADQQELQQPQKLVVELLVLEVLGNIGNSHEISMQTTF